jgi:4-amino-4-deoxy-L-arabinose transferase-like glycosyltransferase
VKQKYLIFLVLLIALIVRLPFLNGSLWLDEGGQAMEALRPWYQQLSIAQDFQPPLLHLIMFPMMQISQQEWWLRLTALVPGLITVYVTYLIGIELALQMKKSKLEQWRAGMLAAVFLSLSAFHVFYSQEMRQYSLAAMWGVCSWYSLLLVLRNAKERRWLILYTLTTLGGLYTMYVYPFLVLSQIVYIFVHRRDALKKLSIALFISGALFSVWLPGFLDQLRVGTTLKNTLTGWSEVVGTPQLKALPLVALKLLGGGKPIDVTWQDALYFGLPIVVIMLVWWKQRKHVHTVLYYWIGASVLGAWMLSFIIPVLQPKRVLFVLPAIYILIAQMIAGMKNSTWKNLCIVAVVGYQLFGLHALWTMPIMQREDWRGMIRSLHESFSTKNTIALFGFYEPFAPWNFYEGQSSDPFPKLSLKTMPIYTMDEAELILPPVLKYHRVLVFDYLRELTDPNRIFEQWLSAHGYSGVASIDTKNIGFIRVYENNSR